MNEDRLNVETAMTMARVNWLSEPMQQDMLNVLRPIGVSHDIVRRLVGHAFAAGYHRGAIDALTMVDEAAKRSQL